MSDRVINGFRMAYDDTGQGTPVLWIHGFPVHRAMWSPQRAGIKSVRHISHDLRGWGQSDAPDGGYTMDVFADDCAALLDSLGVRRAVIAGLSMGGYVAMAFARRHAQRMAGMILICTRATADAPEGVANRRSQAARVVQEGMGVLIDAMLSKLVAAKTLRERPAVVENCRQWMQAARPPVAAATLRGIADRVDSTSSLGQLRCPVLCIGGAEDQITTPPEMEAIRGAVPGAKLVILPDAGHLANIEQPDVFNAAVSEFIHDQCFQDV